MSFSKVFLKCISVFFVLAVLASCGSGGGGSSSGDGRVSILVTDGITDDFNQVNLTVEKVSFIGADNGHQSIVFNESRVINLLALQNYSDLLVTTFIAAGSYDKVRLHISRVELVDFDGECKPGVCIAKLPANGKVDLNPRGTFEVTTDGHLMMALDVDAEKSIHIVEKGNGKLEYNFRPVVFVKIIKAPDDSKLVMLDGKVLAKNETGFRLCDAALIAVDESCFAVMFSERTVVQNDLIMPVIPGDIEDGKIITLLGKVGGVGIEALHIVIGETAPGSGLSLFAGVATSDDAVTSGKFTMLTDDNNETVPALTPLTVSLVDGSGVRIFDKFGDEQPAAAISSGTDVDVFGLALSAADVKAAFIVLDNDATVDKVSGNITAINEVESQLTVVDSTIGDVCVNIDDAQLFMLDIINGKVLAQEIAMGDLVDGMPVEVYGRVDATGCFAADVVLVAPVSVSPLKTPLVTGN